MPISYRSVYAEQAAFGRLWSRACRMVPALALVTFASSCQMQMQPPEPVNLLAKSSGLISRVEQVCGESVNRRPTNLENDERLADDLGMATVYELSAVIITSAITTENSAAYTFVTAKADSSRNCMTILIFNAKPGETRISNSLSDGNFRQKLPLMVSEEVDRLLAECEANPRKAWPIYLYPDYGIFEGQVFGPVEGAFMCESAVLTSLAAVDITAKGSKIRVVYVLDQMFLFEL